MYFSDAAGKLAGSPMFQFLARAQEMERAGKKVYHFEIGDPDFDTPHHVNEAAVAAINRGETHYVNSLGIRTLREAIVGETEKTLGFRPLLEQVVVAPAISFIYFVTRCVANPGDEVIVPDPGFASYYSAFDFIGVKPVSVPLLEKNEFRMSPGDIEKRITKKTKLIIINSPQNPTGAVMTKEELMEVGRIAERHNIYLLTDETYSKMVYDYPHYSPSVLDRCLERTIILNSFSKSYAMTGWRLGWAVAPPAMTEKLGLMIQTIISAVPPFIQEAGIAALTQDQSFIKTSVAEYRSRRDVIVQTLNDIPGVKCLKPEGAFYVFPNIASTGMTSVEFSEFALDKAGVVLLPGTMFGSYGEGYVRLVYATGIADIKEGLGRLSQAFKLRRRS
ncbi:MAG: hypothetical protein A2722_02925 [Candidatus Doudnabacteria bacterium RIFCSPHIGHO2_01_FULL_50_11]|uniref:Aminotransferase n=1 Tax=Candidatus Doudnabacteria bacterium RIFCSPHIGHO2_01_FULL_50_11 TaxID=1817828 RepID=A0A1F5PHY8_9BACT|nr:MAG: hypothetical protein A2722_02925 [Candidatus Doudnabacteria bacterium RIFCSPHIGHO2_01_FULL_50_11]